MDDGTFRAVFRAARLATARTDFVLVFFGLVTEAVADLSKSSKSQKAGLRGVGLDSAFRATGFEIGFGVGADFAAATFTTGAGLDADLATSGFDELLGGITTGLKGRGGRASIAFFATGTAGRLLTIKLWTRPASLPPCS